MNKQGFTSLQAVGTKVVVYQLCEKHFQEKRESGLIIADVSLDKKLFEGVVMSVGNKANPILKQGQYVTFEPNGVRKFPTTRVPANIILLDDDMIYAIIEGVNVPDDIKELMNYES